MSSPRPRRRPRGAISSLGVLLPWTAAGRIYGPYGVSEAIERFRRGEFDAEVEVEPVDQLPVRVVLDPLLRILVPVRAWVGLGVIVFVVKAVAEPDLGGRVKDAWVHGATTMVLGPFGVFLGVVVLLVVGRRQFRATLRSMRRPLAIAGLTVLVSVSIFGLQLPVIRQAVQRGLENAAAGAAGLLGPLWWLLALAAGPWLFLFGVCAVYLMHRNGFSKHSHPYLRPIVASWLACMVAAVELTEGRREGLTDTAFVSATLAGPVVVIVLSIVEAARLHRLGVTVGGPPPVAHRTGGR
jgi:hypothetical protein